MKNYSLIMRILTLLGNNSKPMGKGSHADHLTKKNPPKGKEEAEAKRKSLLRIWPGIIQNPYLPTFQKQAGYLRKGHGGAHLGMEFLMLECIFLKRGAKVRSGNII